MPGAVAGHFHRATLRGAGSAAARAAAFDFAAEQRARAGAENGAKGAVTAIVDAATDQRAGDAADQQAGGAVRTASAIAAIVTAPVLDTVVGAVVPLLLVIVMAAAAVRRRPIGRIGQDRRGGNSYGSERRCQDRL